MRLRREVASLALARDELARLEEENERLRRALDYSESARGAWFAAGVLARSSALAAGRHVLRADKGSLAGVAEGAVVSVPEGLVGRVVSVTPHTCEILLVTDPSLKVACEAKAHLVQGGGPAEESGIYIRSRRGLPQGDRGRHFA